MEMDLQFYVPTFAQRDVSSRFLVLCAWFVLFMHDNVVLGLLDRVWRT